MSRLHPSAADSPAGTGHVATRLLGGLGNQLFQYAAGRALAARLKARLVLDATPYTIYRDRAFALGGYAIDATVAWGGPARAPKRYVMLPAQAAVAGPHRRIFRRLRGELCAAGLPVGSRESRLTVFREASFDYDARFEDLSGSTYLSGYWHSPRYFLRAAGAVRRELQLTTPPLGANRNWLDRIQHARSVCLHIRRGDLTSPSNMRGTCSARYYATAIERIKQRVAEPRFFIFSDDLQWCRENLRMDDADLVDGNGAGDAHEELRLMAACRHHVIANSSLSWWAAWLGEHREQVVIAPEPWFPRRPTPDLLPATWQAMARD